MRGSFPFPGFGGSGGRSWVARLLAALALVAAGLLPLAGQGVAEEEGGAIPVGDFRLLEPISDQLGAAAWMMTSGYDPRFQQIPGGERRTEVDWGSLGVAPAIGPKGGPAFAPPVPFRSAAPAFSRNQVVTRQLGLFPLQTEPHVAVNPLDPEHIVLGVIDYNFPSMSTYTSFDGGETWDGPNQVRYFQDDLTAAGDPVIAFDRDGQPYIVFISLGIEEYRLGSLVSATEVSSIAIARSDDDGLSWDDAVSTARSQIETTSQVDATGRERGEVAVDFLDKPWVTIGPNPDDPETDIIHVVYTKFKTRYNLLYADEVPFLTSPVTETVIESVRSLDGGATWGDPVPVSPVVFQAEGAGEEGEENGPVAEVRYAPPAQPTVTPEPAAADGEAAATPTPDEADAAATPTPTPATPEPVAQTPNRGASAQEEGEGAGAEVDQTVQGPQPAILSDGTLAVTYLDTTLDGVQEGLYTIMIALSRDGGQTFEEPVQAAVLREIHFRPRNSTFRWWGAAFPQIASGPNNDIYILTTAASADTPTDDGDIFLLRSLDGGASWEPPARLNEDDTDRIQFFPSIDVGADGTVHTMWADMRDDPAEVRYHIYYTRSTDQGETFGFVDDRLGINTPDTRVTDFASNSLRGFPGGRFLGDYFSIAAGEEDVYLVWADTRLGEFAGPNQQIAFARQTAIAPPSLFLNPPSGPAGRDVTIQGFGFQPESNISIDIGGITITNLRSNERGEFTTTVYMPVTGEGPRAVTAFDETGNVATASFFTEVGFDTIARELAELAEDRGGSMAPATEPGTPTAATPTAATPVAGDGATPVADETP
jgi:hypothetical protein